MFVTIYKKINRQWIYHFHRSNTVDHPHGSMQTWKSQNHRCTIGWIHMFLRGNCPYLYWWYLLCRRQIQSVKLCQHHVLHSSCILEYLQMYIILCSNRLLRSNMVCTLSRLYIKIWNSGRNEAIQRFLRCFRWSKDVSSKQMLETLKTKNLIFNNHSYDEIDKETLFHSETKTLSVPTICVRFIGKKKNKNK
jgi:hypothetical protein